MAGETLLSTRDVSISFGGVRALRGVSMDIPAGSIVAVIGPNGAGKTTLFNCITGVYRADAGSVTFAGESLIGKKPHQVAALGLARTFQNIELFARMTVLDNVLLGRHRHMKTGPLGAMLFGRKVKRDEVAQRKKVEHILDFLDLQFTRDRFVGQLPYGVRKKIELARALALEPKLLLLDEPSLGLAPRVVEEILQTLGDLNRAGLPIVLVEQKAPLALKLARRAYLMAVGAIAAEIDPRTVGSHDDLAHFYLG